MRKITLNIPDTLDMDDMEAKMFFASKLYEEGELTIGQAAELVGCTKEAFMKILAKYGVSFFNYPIDELDQDIENAENHSN